MLTVDGRISSSMSPGVGPLGEAVGAYAILSMIAIPLTLGLGLDERSASAISIGVGVSIATLLLARRSLPHAYKFVTSFNR